MKSLPLPNTPAQWLREPVGWAVPTAVRQFGGHSPPYGHLNQPDELGKILGARWQPQETGVLSRSRNMAKESHDQKRKRKLEQRKRRERQAESAALAGSLAYMGDRYKTEKLIPSLMRAEVGIYETFVITRRKLLDQTVISAIERLIGEMRSGELPPREETDVVDYTNGQEEDLLIARVRDNW